MDDTMIGRWLCELPMGHPSSQSKMKPKLRRFVHHQEHIRYLKFLGQGTEGAVYLVEIAGNEYAMKIFKNWYYEGREDIPERQRHYTFPISQEARAFARLDYLGENGTWAVKCHGWMKLSDEQYKRVRGLGYSRWAIIKDYLPSPVSMQDVPDIRRKMRIARKALIHPRDAKPDNYRGSFLVDLGRVKTYPYPRQLWSDSKRREYFKWFDIYASKWQESVRDGAVVEGWLNREFKRIMRNAETLAQRRAQEAEEAEAKRLQRIEKAADIEAAGTGDDVYCPVP